MVVVQLEDLDDLAVVVLAERAEQTLGASEEGLLVALGAVDDLLSGLAAVLPRFQGVLIDLPASAYWHACRSAP